MELLDYNDRLQVRKLSEVDPQSINSNAINTIKLVCVGMAGLRTACLLSLVGYSLAAQLRNGTSQSLVRDSTSTNASSAPCQCLANNPAWPATTRAVPKCVFIDLGAADGNSFQQFLANAYGPVANCPSGQWEAMLVEANPQFTPQLNAVAAGHPGQVHVFASTAAYCCAGQTSFSIDPDAGHNHWGSSMKKSFGSTQVTVPTINVMQLIAENVSPADWVILKVDIEGAEYDVIPTLAQFQKANLVDTIFLEEHNWLAGNSVYTPQQYAASKLALTNAGISIPPYHSQTM